MYSQCVLSDYRIRANVPPLALSALVGEPCLVALRAYIPTNPAKIHTKNLTIKTLFVKLFLYFVDPQYQKIFHKPLDKRLSLLYICSVDIHSY